MIAGLESHREGLLAEKVAWNQLLFAKESRPEDKRHFQRAATENAEQTVRVNGLLAGFRAANKTLLRLSAADTTIQEAISGLTALMKGLASRHQEDRDLAAALLTEGGVGEEVARILAPFTANAGLEGGPGELVTTHAPG